MKRSNTSATLKLPNKTAAKSKPGRSRKPSKPVAATSPTAPQPTVTSKSKANPGLILAIVQTGIQLKHMVQARISLEHQLGSTLRRAVGWQYCEEGDKAGQAKMKVAVNHTSAIMSSISKWETAMKKHELYYSNDPMIVAANLSKYIEEDEDLDEVERTGGVGAAREAAVVWMALRPINEAINRHEKALAEQVQGLPVYDWWMSIRGLGAGGLAIIVANTGDLANYSSVPKVWKRLGVGLVTEPTGNVVRQQKRTDAGLALLHGYSPKRRSALFVVVESMLRNNKGKYRETYERRLWDMVNRNPGHATLKHLGKKEVAAFRTVNGKKVPNKRAGEQYDSFSLHSIRDAQRYVSKQLLKDLWTEWNK